jgi:pentapeptide MXKDX repeat protein
MLLRAADEQRNWNLNMGAIALFWSGGCIIRSAFLGDIKKAFAKNAKLENLLADDFFSTAINKYQMSWRKAQIHAIELGIPAPAFSTALAFYDGYRTKRLPAKKDAMGKDSMAKDAMKKDGMASDCMSKDAMAKDGMQKDSMAHDAMGKDSMKKDAMPMAKDCADGGMKKPAMGKDAMGHDVTPTDAMKK